MSPVDSKSLVRNYIGADGDVKTQAAHLHGIELKWCLATSNDTKILFAARYRRYLFQNADKKRTTFISEDAGRGQFVP